jgi:hypothetical protein
MGGATPVETLAAVAHQSRSRRCSASWRAGRLGGTPIGAAPSRVARGKGLLERAGEVRRQIVQNDPDALGPTSVSLRMQTAKSSAARRSVTLTSIATPDPRLPSH